METTMKLVHITPRDGQRLYGPIINKEAEIRSRGRGTFVRAGKRQRNKTRWTHKRYRGRIELRPGSSGLVSAEIRSPDKGDESRMLSSFLDWLDRHFGDHLSSVSIQYQ
jgi:hypothetical protein